WDRRRSRKLLRWCILTTESSQTVSMRPHGSFSDFVRKSSCPCAAARPRRIEVAAGRSDLPKSGPKRRDWPIATYCDAARTRPLHFCYQPLWNRARPDGTKRRPSARKSFEFEGLAGRNTTRRDSRNRIAKPLYALEAYRGFESLRLRH